MKMRVHTASRRYHDKKADSWRKNLCLYALVVFCYPSQACAQSSIVDFGYDPKGAVFCSYSIYLGLRNIGEICFPEASELRQHLETSIEQMETFIEENAPASRMQIDQLRSADSGLFEREVASARRSASPATDICKSARLKGYTDMFEQFSVQSKSKLAESVATLLAVPRKPTMNPCL